MHYLTDLHYLLIMNYVYPLIKRGQNKIYSDSTDIFTNDEPDKNYAMFYNFSGCTTSGSTYNLRTKLVQTLYVGSEAVLDYFISQMQVINIFLTLHILTRSFIKSQINLMLMNPGESEEKYSLARPISQGYIYPSNTNYNYIICRDTVQMKYSQI